LGTRERRRGGRGWHSGRVSGMCVGRWGGE
jgi:hypothetical protein